MANSSNAPPNLTAQIFELFVNKGAGVLTTKRLQELLLANYNVKPKNNIILSRLALLKRNGKIENVQVGRYRLASTELKEEPVDPYFSFIKIMHERYRSNQQQVHAENS